VRLTRMLLLLALALTVRAAGDVADVDSVSLAQGRRAMWKSVAMNGWGQWHNGERVKAALFSATEISILVAALDRQKEWRHWQDLRENSTDEGLLAAYAAKEDFYLRDRNKLLWWWLWAKLVCVLDAYVSGSLSNFDAGWTDEARVILEPSLPQQGAMGLRMRLLLP